MVKTEVRQITMPTPFPVGAVHAYLVKGDSLSIIDAGVKTKEAKEAMGAGLKQEGYTFGDVEQIILTHHHPDHSGLIEEFKQATALYGHINNQPWLKQDEEFFERYGRFFADLYQKSGVPEVYLPILKELRAPLAYAGKGQLTGYLQEGDLLPGHEDFKVMETKGHAQSHISFYRKEDKLLIGGDLLLGHVSSNPLLEPSPLADEERPKPFLQYQRSLKSCLEMELDSILPGHGAIIDHPHQLVRKRLEKAQSRARTILELLEREALTAYQVCERIFPNQIQKQFGLTMSETIGQLDYLVEKGWIEAEEHDGKFSFESKVKI